MVTINEHQYRMAIKMYRPNSLRFEDSWQYIRQATRDKCEGQMNEDSLVVLTNHPRLNARVAVNVVGDIALLDTIQGPLVAKNVSPIEVQIYENHGFRRLTKKEYWRQDQQFDDQTHPQHILDTRQIRNLTGSEHSELRRQVNSVKGLHTRPYHKTDHASVKKLLKTQDRRNPGTYDSHCMYLDNYEAATVYQIDDHIVGFTLVDEISDFCLAANAIIYDSKLQHFPGYATYVMCAQTIKPFLNLQGSETRSLNRWKQSFNPVLSTKNIHLIRP